MNSRTINIDGNDVVIVDKQVFNDMLYRIASEMRESKRKGISSLKESLEFMGCSKSTFYNILNDPKCLIRRSTVNGSYITDSLEQEQKRRERLK
ncbi:hypothetical protein AWE51_00065 [Aquimarina aggregata]|uniref:Uncharacterized protein n=1 Tax=Aquimarina aggregata TaxID=1642818 RepID=A0A163BXJ8_9FLAO|nr:hypothetical protein [Aquimarina aggregata]KZS41875.1 hypothetical protein AWE51_00065 [Aquimarina aggregata]